MASARHGGRYRDGDRLQDDTEIDCGDNSCAVGGGLCCLILVGIIAVMSIASVPPLYTGIQYNQFTKVAHTDTVHGPGRYFVGPFNKFLLFPTTVQTIEFINEARLPPFGVRNTALHTRTKEGLGLHLQVSLQYKLIGSEVGRLYREFNQNYEQVLISSVRDVLIKAASEYEAAQLWTERGHFGDVLQQMVNASLSKTFAECWGLQLMIIDLPDNFETTIIQTQVQKQAMLIREQEQATAQIRAQTTVIQAEYERQVKVLLAQGQANYTVITKEALARAQQRSIDVEAEVLAMVRDNLSLPVEGLVTYQRYGALDDLQGASVLYGFAGPQVLLQSQP